MTQLFQFRAQFEVIVNFAVENNPGMAVIREDWLIARGQVQNLQPRGTERKNRRLVDALLVWAAMHNRGRRRAYSLRRRDPVLMRESGDAAQRPNLSSFYLIKYAAYRRAPAALACKAARSKFYPLSVPMGNRGSELPRLV